VHSSYEMSKYKQCGWTEHFVYDEIYPKISRHKPTTNIDLIIDECIQDSKEHRDILSLMNELSSKYNNNMIKIIDWYVMRVDDTNNTLLELFNMMRIKLPLFDIEEETKPLGFVKLEELEQDDTENYNWINDSYDDYEDTSINGSGNRHLKGSGKNNHSDPYTQKGVRYKLKNMKH
jgi:hypothetical protein